MVLGGGGYSGITHVLQQPHFLRPSFLTLRLPSRTNNYGVQVDDAETAYKCLGLHHSRLDGRLLNVERSSGGGKVRLVSQTCGLPPLCRRLFVKLGDIKVISISMRDSRAAVNHVSNLGSRYVSYFQFTTVFPPDL